MRPSSAASRVSARSSLTATATCSSVGFALGRKIQQRIVEPLSTHVVALEFLVPCGLFGLRLDAAAARALGLTRLRRDALFFFFSFGRGTLEGGGRSSPPPPADAPQRNRAGLGERLRKS
jgi:hypothetical protein